MRRLRPTLSALVLLAACGDSADDIALARCKEEVLGSVRPASGIAVSSQAGTALRDDAVYGWHVDIDFEAEGSARRAGFRCLFLVENRDTPLFLAVVER